MEHLLDALGIDSEAVARGAGDLADLGVRRGGVLLVHSGFRNVRARAGTVETVIATLATALGPAGTLLLPALSYEHVTRDRPVFDLHQTPSNVGAIAEMFRLLPVTQRSVHPTHSVCGYGRDAEDILATHHLDTTPVGPASPFRAVPEYRGQLLMLGCGLRPNTSIHGIEELAGAPYVLGPEITYTIRDGRTEYTVCHRRHHFDNLTQRYERIVDVLPPSAVRTAPVFGAECGLIEAAELWSRCTDRIRNEPYYFVERAS